jgi:hypothetical protein
MKSIIDNPSKGKLGEWSLGYGGIVTGFVHLLAITAGLYKKRTKLKKS